MKRLLLTIFVLTILANIASAALVMGDVPEEIVINEPNMPDFEDITGNAVAEPDDSSFGYIFFIITLGLVILAAVVFLFQRVKPRGRR